MDYAKNQTYPDIAKDIITWPIDPLRRYLDEECRESPPSLEEMYVWASLRGYEPSINPTTYTFVSHMHDMTHANRLGSGQIDALCSLEGNIWFDLTSMYQGKWSGYDYFRHTKPVVEQLHVIMMKATCQAVILSGYETDPMLMRGKMGNAVSSLQNLSQCAFFQHFCENASPPYCLKEKILSLQKTLEAVELPVDKYFGRLWCYVERLAIRGTRPDFVLNGKGGQLLETVVAVLLDVQQDLKRIAALLNFPLDTTITVFNPWMYERRELKYALRDIERAVTTCQKLWGIDGSRGEGCLDPFSAVETLDCYCDADRVILYEIECSLRGIVPNSIDFCACTQLALGKHNQQRTRHGLTARDDNSNNWGLHSVLKQSIGKSRQITALDICLSQGYHTSAALERILNDSSILFHWIAAAQRAGNIEIRFCFWSLLHISPHEYFVIQKRNKRHFRVGFRPPPQWCGSRTSVPKWVLLAAEDIPIPKRLIPKTFNPTSNTQSVFGILNTWKNRGVDLIAVK